SAVTHVDSSKPAVAWARRNAERNALADRPVRWIVDDALAFTIREARRGRRYAGVVLDPPSYGHAADGRRSWRLDSDLPDLLDAIDAILEPAGFVLLTAHSEGIGPDALAEALEPLAWGATRVEADDLVLTAGSGARLPLGAYARVDRA
ncbi:MAG TPA: hypothetical protein VD763_00235, partial [Candidatus Saccharimonadales bacterium]|nr:hypothetical protein [Candidatus Saccharimonadales bacterium]